VNGRQVPAMTENKMQILALSGYGSSEFEDLEVTESIVVIGDRSQAGRMDKHSKWGQILAYVLLLLLLLAVAAGAAVISVHASDNWIVVMLLAGVALGFGVAALFYRRFIDQQALSLKSELQEARNRADALGTATGRLRARRSSSGS
jgi:positive regulator of sigma E activity